MPVDLNNVWEKLCEVKHELHGSLGMRTHSVEELKEKQADLTQRLANVQADDTISLKNGLAYIITSISDAVPHNGENMARKLMHDQYQVKEKKTRAKREREPSSGPPYPRPPGKAKKDKTWCPDTGTWVEEKTA